MTAIELLEELMENTKQSIVETEGIIQAQQGALVTYKKLYAALAEKKTQLEKD